MILGTKEYDVYLLVTEDDVNEFLKGYVDNYVPHRKGAVSLRFCHCGRKIEERFKHTCVEHRPARKKKNTVCVVCGNDIRAKGRYKTCSKKCHKKREREMARIGYHLRKWKLK